MRNRITIFGVAAGLAACVGGAALAPGGMPVAASCRQSDAVKWIALAEEQFAQNAWCAAVGSPVVENAPSESAAQLDSMPVVSWNVKVGGGDVRRLVTQLRRGRLTGGEPIEHFVLLLQEAHRAGATVPAHVAGARVPRGIAAKAADGTRRSIDNVARELGLSLAYVPSMRNGGRTTAGEFEDRGSAVLSTLPLHDIVAIELPLVRQRRVVVAANVAGRTTQGDDWTVQFASVHLENRPARGVTGVSERDLQMQHLLRVLPAAEQSVMGGDLNTWARGAAEPAVARALEQHPDTGPAPVGPTFDGPALFDVKLDYLFARMPEGRMSGYERVEERFGSDHHPMLGWVHLTR